MDIPDSASMSTVSVINGFPQQKADLPLALTAAGEIASIESREDYFTIRLKDDFGNEVEIDIKPYACSILKDNKSIGIDQMRKGATAYIVYTQNGNRNQAAFINIVRPEDIEVLRTP